METSHPPFLYDHHHSEHHGDERSRTAATHCLPNRTSHHQICYKTKAKATKILSKFLKLTIQYLFIVIAISSSLYLIPQAQCITTVSSAIQDIGSEDHVTTVQPDSPIGERPEDLARQEDGDNDQPPPSSGGSPQPQPQPNGLLADLWSSLTSSGKNPTCPGECVHAITSIFCDHVLEDVSCGAQYLRCCVPNDFAAPPQGTAVETSPPFLQSQSQEVPATQSASSTPQTSTAASTTTSSTTTTTEASTTRGSTSAHPLTSSTLHLPSRSTYPPTGLYEVNLNRQITTTSTSTTPRPSYRLPFTPPTSSPPTSQQSGSTSSQPIGIECPGVCIEYRFARYCGNILSNGRCSKSGQQCCLQADQEPVKPRPTEILHAGGNESPPSRTRPSLYAGPHNRFPPSDLASQETKSTPTHVAPPTSTSSTTPLATEDGLWPRPSPSTPVPTLLPPILKGMLPGNDSLLESASTNTPLEPCHGTCVAPLFSLLCDDIDATKFCPSGASCCLSREEEEQARPPPPTTTTPEPTTTVPPCPGTCIPTVLSGVCTRPSRLILKNSECSTGLICCYTPANAFGGNIPPPGPPPGLFPSNGMDSRRPPQPPMHQQPPPQQQHPQQPFPPGGFFGLPNFMPNQRMPYPQPHPQAPEHPYYPQQNYPAPTQRPSTAISTLSTTTTTTPLPTWLASPLCPGTCLPPMLRFTCLGSNSLYPKFHCQSSSASADLICCAPMRDIQAFETNLMAAQNGGNPLAVAPNPESGPRPGSGPREPPTHPVVGVSPPRNVSFATPSSYIPNMRPVSYSPSYNHGNRPATSPFTRPSSTHSTTTTTTTTSTTTPSTTTTTSESTSYGGHICGIKGVNHASRPREAARIIGGRDSLPGEYCWHVALINAQNQYLCGGALIADQWVTTAAHCVTSMVRQGEPIFVRVGDYDLTDTDPAEQVGAQTARVGTTYIHHNHNGQTLDNDIALLKLSKPVHLNHMTCLICLPARGSKVKPGKRCTIAGYGYRGEAGPIALKIRSTEIPMVQEQECTGQINSITEKSFTLPANSFCAGGEPGEDACQGDGGSGLVCTDPEGVFELAGLVSWGFGCGREHVPGVYVNLAAFVGWINQIISVNN